MTQQDRSDGAGEPVRGELVPMGRTASMRDASVSVTSSTNWKVAR